MSVFGGCKKASGEEQTVNIGRIMKVYGEIERGCDHDQEHI